MISKGCVFFLAVGFCWFPKETWIICFDIWHGQLGSKPMDCNMVVDGNDVADF